jgi:uncharacterized membrane protein
VVSFLPFLVKMFYHVCTYIDRAGRIRVLSDVLILVIPDRLTAHNR